jgi:hypothetical protein
MSILGDYIHSIPGVKPLIGTSEREILAGLYNGLPMRSVIISEEARDSTNAETRELRRGLIMAELPNGEYTNYDPANANADLAVGVLWEARRQYIYSTGATQKSVGNIILSGYLKASQLLGLDEQARNQMQGRFYFDDRLVHSFGEFQRSRFKTANFTVVNGRDNGLLFTNQTASAAITATLGNPARGNRFIFYVESAQNFVIAAPSGKLVTKGNSAATSVTLTGIGSSAEVFCNYDATKWIVVSHLYDGQSVTVA